MLMQYVLAPVAFLACIVQVFAADLSPTLDDLALPPAAAPAAVVRRCGPLPTRDCDPTIARGRGPGWLEVWGYADLTGIFTGERMAPNGELFKPLFATGINLNIGLLPNKKLYTFIESRFWMQKAGEGITNPTQGKFDFSKRELDFNAGIAWNWWDRFETRASAYSGGNLNRGYSKTLPDGYKDGILIETRYYFGSANIYDVSRLSFVSLGYYPSKSLVGGNGEDFQPSLFARAHATYDIPFIRSYLYGDVQFAAERVLKPRLLEFDAGIATRPFSQMENVEFRLGDNLITDIQVNTARNIVYGAVRVVY